MGKMEDLTKVGKRKKQTSEELSDNVATVAKNLSEDIEQGSESVVANVFMKKERFNKPTNFSFCYQNNWGQLVNKLTLMEIKVATALVRLCEFGNLINIQKQLVAGVAEVHPTHIAKIYKSLTQKGFLIEKKNALTSINGSPVNQVAVFINPVFYSKGQTDMFVGQKRKDEGVTMEEGLAKAKPFIEPEEVLKVDAKLKNEANKTAKKATDKALKKIRDSVAEIDPRQRTIFEDLDSQITEAINEKLNEDEEIKW